jgi:polar amino acid transport system substrate-binding protein
MKMRAGMRFILALWIGLLSAGTALAQDLRVIASDFPTISQQTPDNKQIGLGVEVVAEMAKRMGITYSIEFLPWRRCLAMMQKGEADILIGPYRTPERFAFMDFPATPI